MSIKARLRPAYSTVRTALRVSMPTARKTVLVYGNCQAAALGSLLRSNPTFSEEYRLIQLPGAHEILPAELVSARRAFAKADLIITQKIRDGYRSLQIGTDQFLALRKPSAQVITYPSMFYRGLHPFLVYVHATGTLGTPAPHTEGYHDLRFIYAAAKGMNDDQASLWLTTVSSHAPFIRAIANESLAVLKTREGNLDTSVSHMIPQLGAEAFWTLNHPSNAVLATVAKQVLTALGKDDHLEEKGEFLTSVVVPVATAVREALVLETPRQDEKNFWIINGKSLSDDQVMKSHLAYYRSRPEVLSHAIAEHRESLHRAGFSVDN